MVNKKASLTLVPKDSHNNDIPMGSSALNEYKLTVTHNDKENSHDLSENKEDN